MRIHLLSHAVRHALLAGTALGVALPFGIASAQDDSPDQQQATTLDRIEVTGSRIRQVDIETEAPVQIISREHIERQGFQSVADILQNLSSTGSPAISRAAPLSSGEAVGGQFIDLRNIGTQRTLVLVNGKRLGISTNGLQDISLIPTAMVERIEVLKDGASSIYGSDAIAGVINIITRSGYDGAQANAYFGQYSEGDGETTRGDFVMGFTGDRGSLTMAAEYRKEEGVWAKDRPFSAYPQTDRHPTRGWTTVSHYGVINLPAELGGNRVLDPGADWRDIANYHAQDCDVGSVGANVAARCQHTGGVGSIDDKANSNLQMHLRTPIESRSLFVDGVYDVNDAIRFRANMLYSDRDAATQVAGYPLTGIAMSADSYYNPVGSHHGFADPQAATFFRRTWEVPRLTTQNSTTWRFTAGLEGSFEIGERYFDWDVGYLYNNNKVIQHNSGNLWVTKVQQAVGPSFLNPETGRVECGTPGAPIPYGTATGQCIPWNPLIPYGREGDGGLTNNAELQDFLFPLTRNTGETETNVFSANLSGVVATLPAGELGFAVGVETRKEEGQFIPDALATAGETTNLAAGPTRGDYSVDELYAELLIPVLSDMPGAQDLSFSLASRYSDYDTFGDTVNSKFGFKWKPVESLLVRGTWAEGFRAPTIANLYGGGSQTFSFYTDPCDTQFGASATNGAVRARCAQDIADADNFRQLGQGGTAVSGPDSQTGVPFFSGSNPDLSPETSRSKTLGLVWSPPFAERLNMSLDWWKIRVDSTIVADSPTQMLNDCYIQGDASRCVDFTRDPTTGVVNTLSFAVINAGYREIEGFDFDVSYGMDTDVGDFQFNWQSTYKSRDEIKTDTNPDSNPSQLVSIETNNLNGNFRIRSNLNLTWSLDDFSVTWGARYFSAQKEACVLPVALYPGECSDINQANGAPTQSGSINRTGSNTFHDLQVSWKAPWDATVAIGANNVFDRYGPPLYVQPSSNFAYQGEFDIGRFVYMKYQQRF
ncbi:TonB-dependent receptor domain-containing protein [Luteimonas sp. R10]|uniref:TonB-dependent receptor domain-containing protein n=1 Tax=Luteimonas sp. R10 TaxID=3108176 RepID=UPI00308ACA32|nr:TonB-dependent receptor [Luteimonas sp. R10]